MGEGVKIEDYYTQLKRVEDFARVAACYGEERIKWLQVKYSAEMLQYCIDYFASFSFQIPEVRYKEEVIVSPQTIQGKLKTGQPLSFSATLERLNYLIKTSIEDFFRLRRGDEGGNMR